MHVIGALKASSCDAQEVCKVEQTQETQQMRYRHRAKIFSLLFGSRAMAGCSRACSFCIAFSNLDLTVFRLAAFILRNQILDRALHLPECKR